MVSIATSLIIAVSLIVWGFIENRSEIRPGTWIKVSGDVYSAISITVIIFLIFSYTILKKKLNEIFGSKMSVEFQILTRTFTMMLIVYFVFTGYMIGFGAFYKLICKSTVRWILCNISNVVFEYGIVLPIVYIYHTCIFEIEGPKPEIEAIN